MNVLADFHHGDLYYSLQLLFEKRLGWNLFKPIGLEWAQEGYWDYSRQGDTIKQFLGLDQGSLTPERRHNETRELIDDIYYVYDPVHDTYQKGLTLEKFRQMDIDIVISSVSQHDITFERLIQEVKPSAKHISHIGNIFQQRQAGVKNIMASAKLPYIPDNINIVSYHQEFDLNIYKPSEMPYTQSIKSFQNCLPQLFPEDYEVYKRLKELLPDYDFKSYGGSCDNGSLNTARHIAHEMQTSKFGFHCKKLGDGFGHVIHNWFAIGKPIITRGSDYQDKLAGDLLVDGETCFDIEKHSLEELASVLRDCQGDRYLQMCDAVKLKFKEKVDFDKEFVEIKAFLDRLQ